MDHSGARLDFCVSPFTTPQDMLTLFSHVGGMALLKKARACSLVLPTTHGYLQHAVVPAPESWELGSVFLGQK